MFKNCWLNEQWMSEYWQLREISASCSMYATPLQALPALVVVQSHMWYLVEWYSDSQWLSTPKPDSIIDIINHNCDLDLYDFLQSFPTASYAIEMYGGWPLGSKAFPHPTPFSFNSVGSWKRGQDNGSWIIFLSRSPINYNTESERVSVSHAVVSDSLQP